MRELEIIRQAAEAARDVSRAVISVIDTVAHAAKTSVNGYDRFLLRRETSRTDDIITKTMIMANAPNVDVLWNAAELLSPEYVESLAKALEIIENFQCTQPAVKRPTHSRQQKWDELRGKLTLVVADSKRISRLLRRLRGEFIHEPTHAAMIQLLSERLNLISSILERPMPRGKGQVDALQSAFREYERNRNCLIESCQTLIEFRKTHRTERKTEARKLTSDEGFVGT
jgi:hypothetical protein